MSEVTVKAMQPVLGLADGAVVTIERTRRVDVAIKAGRLTVIDDSATGAKHNPAPEETVADTVENTEDAEPAETPTPRAKRVKKLAGIDDKD